MRALSSLIHVNAPNLVLFVGEALVGNDAVDQLVKFNRWGLAAIIAWEGQLSIWQHVSSASQHCTATPQVAGATLVYGCQQSGYARSHSMHTCNAGRCMIWRLAARRAPTRSTAWCSQSLTPSMTRCGGEGGECLLKPPHVLLTALWE